MNKKLKSTKSWMFLSLIGLLIFAVSCKQDEATINTYIQGSWKADSTQTVYNGGLLAQYFNINSDSIGTMVKPAFDGCQFTFNSDKAGAIAFPYMELKLTDTYEVSTGKVTMTLSSLAGKQITLNVTSITAKQMVATMSISDFSILASAVDTSATSNVDLMATLESLVPALANLNNQLSKINFSSVGLNPTPTVTLVFNKQ